MRYAIPKKYPLYKVYVGLILLRGPIPSIPPFSLNRMKAGSSWLLRIMSSQGIEQQCKISWLSNAGNILPVTCKKLQNSTDNKLNTQTWQIYIYIYIYRSKTDWNICQKNASTSTCSLQQFFTNHALTCFPLTPHTQLPQSHFAPNSKR